MAEIRSLVCDVCGNDGATGYSISVRGNNPWIIDLCSTCAQPLEVWQRHGRAPAGKKRPYRKYGLAKTTPREGP